MRSYNYIHNKLRLEDLFVFVKFVKHSLKSGRDIHSD